jgi:hypothetical protein
VPQNAHIFRRKAEACWRAARRAHDPQHKREFKELAQAWLRLADRAEHEPDWSAKFIDHRKLDGEAKIAPTEPSILTAKMRNVQLGGAVLARIDESDTGQIQARNLDMLSEVAEDRPEGAEDMAGKRAAIKPPTRPCPHCNKSTVLRTTIPKFGDRRPFHIFCCEGCGALEWVSV